MTCHRRCGLNYGFHRAAGGRMRCRPREPRGMNETNVPAEQQATEKKTRLPGPDEQSGRAAGTQAQACQGAQAPRGVDSAEAAAALRRPDPRPPGAQRFSRRVRLRKRPEFLTLQQEGRRRTTPHFVVITRNRKSPPSRLGLTTSRRVGGAPHRNRVRRLVREFFRRNQTALVPPRDVLVIARPGAALLRYDDVVRELASPLGLAVPAE